MSRESIGSSASELISLSIRNTSTGAWTNVDVATNVTWALYEVAAAAMTAIDTGTATQATIASSPVAGLYIDYADTTAADDYAWLLLVWTFTVGGVVQTQRDWMQVRPTGEDVPSQIDDIHDWLADGGRTDLILDGIVNQLGRAVVTVSSPASESANLVLRQAVDYRDAIKSAIEFVAESPTSWPNTTPNTLTFTVENKASRENEIDAVAASIVTWTTSERRIRVELTEAQTAAMTAGEFVAHYELMLEWTGIGRRVFASGEVTVISRLDEE